ncbi:MAG: TetR/AcrR family transcriptional regulator [Syntrophomonadaceae bacterium]|nr:TetR/AcrR family transcriptional regulator [Syntrophomonadaceae bacterium]
MNSENSTRQKIINVAVDLFAENGYDTTSLRDIAKLVGIKPASIYNHFKAKADIIEAIYDMFMEEQQAVLPDLNSFLKRAETDPPLEVLMGTNFHYSPDIQEMMDKILIIATFGNRNNPRSAEILQNCIFNLPVNYTKPILEHMLELGRIEPLDVEAFVVLLSNFCYSAAIRNHSSNPVTWQEWYKGVTMLFQLIIPTGK